MHRHILRYLPSMRLALEKSRSLNEQERDRACPPSSPTGPKPHRLRVGDGARGIENEHAVFSSLRTLVDSENRSMSAVRFFDRALSLTLILASRWFDMHGQCVRRCGPIHLIVTASSPRKYISKDIISTVERMLFCNHYKKNVAFLLLSCCSSLASAPSCHSRASWHCAGTSVKFYTLKMLSDLFHSRPEGLQAIY